MKITRLVTALLMAVSLVWAFAAQAGTTTFQGVSVDYGSASTNWVDGELVLTYANSSSLAISDGAVNADILVVGGGGGGGGGYSSNYGGGGGGGGAVKEGERIILDGGELTVTVGTGGSGGASGRAGSKGGDSSVAGSGFESVTAQGGAAGAAGKNGKPSAGTGASGTGTTGVKSEVTGKTYGAGGAAGDANAPGSPAANTGAGGKGGMKSGTLSKRTGGAGGSGVVVVRLKEAYASVAVTLKDLTLGASEEVSTFADVLTGAAADIAYGKVSSVQFTDEGVVRTERTKDGKLKIVGAGPGATTATIVLLDAAATKMTTYTVNVTVNPSIALQDLTIQRGEMVTAFALLESGDAMTFDSADVKEVLFAKAEIAERGETADGKVGLVGKLAGATEVTIVQPGQSYVCTVTVNPLITGLYRAGAYEVAVTNASAVKYVDGDLVITYLDTNVAVEKSFTLPQATTGRLLAVGGGGAGGQEPGVRNDTYGLPGGGGAGGLVIADNQTFGAETYTVAVGAGGVAPRTKPSSATAGASGAATTVKVDGVPMLTAKGGGGGGARSAGKAGGSGGGGSYSGGTKDGGTASQSDGFANAGGQGAYELFGGGGGGAGGAGGKTGSYTAFYNKNKKTFTDPTAADVYLSGAGGVGMTCDITGEMLEYARGGAGGVPRLYAYYYRKDGKTYYTNSEPSDREKSDFDGGKYFWCEAEDGKPGRDGYGDGGGGGSYYSTKYGPTFAGSGGNGALIVRIPPYKTTVEDALKHAFVDQPVTVSGNAVTLKDDVAGPICIPDNLGAVTVDLNGHAIVGANGALGDDITPGGDGQPTLKIVPHEYDCESGVTTLSVTGTGSLTGGSGGTGYPGGAGAQALSADGFTVNVAGGIVVTAGEAGESLVQHPHKWAYAVEDGKIIAYCVADDGVECSYRDHSRGPFVAVSAADASYTAMRYDELNAVNGITPVTGVVIAPETYAGRDGTDYPESSTPPREQGAYTVSMKLGDLRITSDFTITEPKPSQGSVYQAWKTAERKGRDVQIVLSATFDGSKAINDGNVLFLGSRCSAHSMANGTVESSVNALTRYANVRWYAYGSDDPNKNLVNQLTKKGEEVPDGTVTIVGRNHFVHKEMMDDLYAELVEKKNIPGDYDLILLEFDGDLLGRDSASPYELVYSLPAGWDDEKAARLRAAMSRYYAEDRVVWIVPDVNRPKEDEGYTGEYPWTSNPEFIWQRAFLNATETKGYKCPLQKNYEDADSLVDYLQEVLVGHFFSNAIIKDTLASGLTIKKVTPQMRADGGIWHSFEGGPSHYTIPEPRSGTTVTADVERVERQVTVTFDMKAEQAWACEHNQVIGDDFRVVIDAELDGFFSVGEGEWQETNEGPATFTFTESNLDDDDEDFTITVEKDSPKIQNVKLTPDYSAEDVVKTYDGIGTNIVVRPIAPTPEDAIIRYSFDEHGTYTDNLSLTNVCEKTKVWFEITDKNGEFTTVTNFACVTILPLPPGPPQEESMGIEAFNAEKFYDAEGTNITWVVTNATGAAIADATISLREKGTDSWIPAADFTLYIDTTNVTVEVRAAKDGFGDCFAEATVDIWPRPVTLVAASDSKVFDGLPLTNWTFEVKEDAAPEYGFVKDEGVASVTMTDDSTITDPGSQQNVIATEVAKDGTKLERNYDVTTVNGTLTVTAASMGIEAFPAEKFYDAEPTNITYVVTNAQGVAITDATISLREKGTDTWIPAANFVRYIDTTNVTVEVRAAKDGFGDCFAEATVDIWPRPVTLIAASDSKVYDGLPLTNWTFEVKEDEATPGYGFVKDEGVASVTMTAASTVTNPGSQPNVIATTVAKDGTKLERNYDVTTVNGTLTVTAASMGIEAFPAEKFYDAEPTNITWVVTNANGVAITDATIFLREKGTTEWIPAADFTLYVDTTNVTVEVKAEKSGFYPVEASATVLVKPRPVTLVAGSAEKAYDGTPLTCDDFAEKKDETTAVIPGYGFVKDEGVASVTMTDDSTITDPGSTDNVIATEIAKPNTKLERNYTVTTVNGTLIVTAAPMGIAAFDAEKFYDAEPTNITYVVTNATGAAISDATIFLREKGTTEWIPAADFTLYVDTTNVTVEVKAEKSGFYPVEASATVLVKPRPVTLVAGSAEKAYDGTPLTCDDFAEKKDETTAVIPGYGFVPGEGVASVTMTPESTITDPGSQPNVIAATVAKDGTKLDRNYIVSKDPGTLTVNAATFTSSAEPVEKFYDSTPTNITVKVAGVPAGVTPTYEYSYSETEGFVPASDFTGPTNVSETATVYCRVIIPGTTNVVSAVATIRPRIVVHHAEDGEWTFNGEEHAQPDYFEDTDDEAERSKAKWGTDEVLPGSVGFVEGEGYASDLVMTEASKITNPGTKPNVIDTAADKTALATNTKPENYELYYLDGTLTVTAATMGIAAFPAEKFYDAEPTNITYVVTNAQGAAITDATIFLREKGTDPWIPAADFVPYVDTTNVTVQVRAEKSGFASVEAEATVIILPRVVVQKAGDASKDFDGTPLRCDDSGEAPERELEEAEKLYGEDGADAIGFVSGEGFATVPMTADSEQTEPGTHANLIDDGAVTLAEGTKSGNYIFFCDPGLLTVIQRQEEVRRDPGIVIPEESKKAVEESDRKIAETLNELVKSDPKSSEEPYIKYQLTVTPVEKLSESTRTTPEKAAEDVKKQVELAARELGAEVGEAKFVDIVLERTYDKTEAEETAKGNYNKGNWESLDKAEEHGNRIFEITIPFEVPEGMELVGVTRSCDSRGTEVLKPKDPNDPNAEGFVYDPETKTVTLYARDFCVFGFMMTEKTTPTPSPHGDCEPKEEEPVACVYKFKAHVYTTKGVVVSARGRTSVCDPDAAGCLVMRGKDKTVLEGWLYQCECTCDGIGESVVIWDSRRRAPFADATLETIFLNIIGARSTDAEWAWTFAGTVEYDSVRSQEYELVASGYGTFNVRAGRFTSFSGCFAGTASAPYDLMTKRTPETADCLCVPSRVLKCDSADILDFTDEPTVIFGQWKVKYDAAASKAYRATGRLSVPRYVK